MKITLDLPDIEGFEYTGEYRTPVKDEYFANGEAAKLATVHACHYPILKKKEPEYKVFKIGKNTDGGEYLNIDKSIQGCGGALVSINALEDLYKITTFLSDYYLDDIEMSERQYQVMNSIKELLK